MANSALPPVSNGVKWTALSSIDIGDGENFTWMNPEMGLLIDCNLTAVTIKVAAQSLKILSGCNVTGHTIRIKAVEFKNKGIVQGNQVDISFENSKIFRGTTLSLEDQAGTIPKINFDQFRLAWDLNCSLDEYRRQNPPLKSLKFEEAPENEKKDAL